MKVPHLKTESGRPQKKKQGKMKSARQECGGALEMDGILDVRREQWDAKGGNFRRLENADVNKSFIHEGG